MYNLLVGLKKYFFIIYENLFINNREINFYLQGHEKAIIWKNILASCKYWIDEKFI